MKELEAQDEVATQKTESVEDNEKTVSSLAFYKVKQEMKSYKEQLERMKLAEDERESAKLSELEKLQKEIAKRDKDIAERDSALRAREIKDKKQAAFFEAKTKIGDGFVLESEAEQKLLSKLDKLSYDEESYIEDIMDLVELAKRPKRNSGASPINLGASDGGGKDPLSYTASELKQIERDDPHKAEQIYALRSQARRKQ